MGPYLEDHPRTCKWSITMVVVVVPVNIGLSAPSNWPNFMAEINGGDVQVLEPILQVPVINGAFSNRTPRSRVIT